MKRRGNKIASRILLMLFLGYYGSISIFTHSHSIFGDTYVHSHPYLPSSDEGPVNHSHSKDALLTLAVLSEFQAETCPVLFSLPNPITETNAPKEFFNGNNYVYPIFNTSSLRAPPSEKRA